ncbi:hypothetical protein [Microscilla marina]|uniref:Uncharacterized protein n=1 Tax=Microscilla marina ATCC 23134 TaxID=313606 RepID=A1ZDV3_MICM2|nr:hypothetical protein [Microscilla marina]EAY31261.1 hypothetical protein M23134_04094 [Microscilla marina ATCC 23134]
MALTYDIEKDAFYQKGVKKGKEEGKEEGKKEGREEVKIEMVLGLINSGKLTLSEIAQLAKISLEQVQKIAGKV